MGLIPAVRGRIRLRGETIDRLSAGERQKRSLRLLPEERGIFPDLTVGENIDVVAGANCAGSADLFSPAQVRALFPVLLEKAAVRAGSLSGGQQQMLAMSLAILGTPRCLMLDEPSIRLAPNLVERLFDQLRDLCRGHAMSAILVEQNVAAAMRVADRLLIMDNGEIVFAGLPDEAWAANVWECF